MTAWEGWSALPREVWALLLAPAGWLVAWALRTVTTALLNLVHFDALAHRLGLDTFLKTGLVPYTPSRFVGRVVYWVLMLATLVGVSVLLDLALVTAVSARLLELGPGLLAAVVILVIGWLLVGFVSNGVLTLARNAAWTHAQLVARAVRVLGVIVVLGVASEQIGLNLTLLHSLLLIVAGGLALGLALAFGLGGQDLARQVLKSWATTLSEREQRRGPDLEG